MKMLLLSCFATQKVRIKQFIDVAVYVLISGPKLSLSDMIIVFAAEKMSTSIP